MSDPSHPTPEEARRARRVLIGFMTFFAIAAIGTTIFGFQVVARVKATARESDAALRTVAWSLLAVADSTGAFPTTPEDLVIASGPPVTERLAGPLDRVAAEWPMTRAAAMADLDPLPIADALGIVEVAWPPTPDLPPVLSVGGRPSGLVEDGPTIDHVNRWLRTAATSLDSSGSSGG